MGMGTLYGTRRTWGVRWVWEPFMVLGVHGGYDGYGNPLYGTSLVRVRVRVRVRA